MSFGGGGGSGLNNLKTVKKNTKKPPKKKQRLWHVPKIELPELQPLPAPPDPAPPATEYIKDSISPTMERNRRRRRKGLNWAKQAGETGGAAAAGAKTTLGG